MISKTNEWEVSFFHFLGKILFGFILIGLFQDCGGPRVLVRDPLYQKKINFSKRLVVVSNPENQLTKMEQSTLSEITRELVNHHKEFIVYPLPQKFSGSCNRDFPKVEGILLITLRQNQEKNKLKLNATASLLQCPESRELWRVFGQNEYDLNEKENESLKNTYIQKFGLGIGNRVNPYYKMISDLIHTLDSPILSAEEIDEKIEVGSN